MRCPQGIVRKSDDGDSFGFLEHVIDGIHLVFWSPEVQSFFFTTVFSLYILKATFRSVSETFLFIDKLRRSCTSNDFSIVRETSIGQRGFDVSPRTTGYSFMNLRLLAIPRRTLSCTFFIAANVSTS